MLAPTIFVWKLAKFVAVSQYLMIIILYKLASSFLEILLLYINKCYLLFGKICMLNFKLKWSGNFLNNVHLFSTRSALNHGWMFKPLGMNCNAYTRLNPLVVSFCENSTCNSMFWMIWGVCLLFQVVAAAHTSHDRVCGAGGADVWGHDHE